MTPSQAGALMKAARHALRRGQLLSYDICLLDCLMFSCRAPGLRHASVSSRRLRKLTGVCKDNVIAGTRRLAKAGLLRRDNKRRTRVAWRGIMASRQASIVYEFLPPATGSTAPTAYREHVSFYSAATVVDPDDTMERALARLGNALGATPM